MYLRLVKTTMTTNLVLTATAQAKEFLVLLLKADLLVVVNRMSNM